MKKNILLALLIVSGTVFSQEMRLLKGAVTENLVVNDSVNETFSIYLPTTFELTKPWPVLFIFDMNGNAKASISMLLNAAESEGYVLASSNNLNDTLSITQNVLIANRMFNAVVNTIPVAKNRTYAAGFGNGARFASILPTFIKEIKGVISIGASVGNVDVLNVKESFQFIGIVNRSNYNFTEMLQVRSILDKLKYPNQLFVYDGERILPDSETIALAMRMLILSGMAKNNIDRDGEFIDATYDQLMIKANTFLSNEKPILASYLLSDIERVFNPLKELDTLKNTRKLLKRSSSFKQANRIQNSYFLKESLVKEDYSYYLEEDILSYNYSNIGWWNYQIEELNKLDKSRILSERQMASRLRGYLNALIADNVDFIAADKTVDLEALNLLYMIKTITAPNEYEAYLKIISTSANMEDYGTALFYLEELLKNGYTNKDELYALEHTALLRITPEFNELVEKYLKEARYDIIEQ